MKSIAHRVVPFRAIDRFSADVSSIAVFGLIGVFLAHRIVGRFKARMKPICGRFEASVPRPRAPASEFRFQLSVLLLWKSLSQANETHILS